MPLRLYNTRTRAVEPFAPLEPDHVRLYVCGLTPSAEAHLGHARSFLFFDVLRRYLAHPHNGYRVTFVQQRDRHRRPLDRHRAREGTTYDAVMTRHYASFKASMRRLGVREPDHEPYATRFVPEIVAMIGELIAAGHAYASEDGVYYAVEQLRALRRALGQAGRRAAGRRAHRRERAQARPARLRAVEVRQARRAALGLALGRRSGGRAGTSSAAPMIARAAGRPLSTCTAAATT